jgi:hypothetical protein
MAAVRRWKVANVGIRGDGSCEKMEGGKCVNRRRWGL